MIVNNVPRVRANYAADLAAEPHLHEGKFAKLNEAGEIELAQSADDAQGIITEPDSYATAAAGNRTGASLLYRSYGGIVELQLGDTEDAVEHGSYLVLDAEGRVKADKGATRATALAMAVQAATVKTPGQLIQAILL